MNTRLFWRFFLLSAGFLLAFIYIISALDVTELPAAVIGVLMMGLLSLGLALPLAKSSRKDTEVSARRIEQLQARVVDLESQRDQAEIILETMGEAVCALNREGQVLWVNRSAERLLGVRQAEAAGKRLVELFRRPELEGLLTEAFERGESAVREVHAFGPRDQTIRLQAVPCGAGTHGAALVVVAQDVTEMRRLEGLRREFVANVSHELKTPLTSIRGLAETLLNGALEDAANNRRFVGLIDEDAARLSRLIDDLLELSQIESKASPLRLQPVDVRALIDELAGRFRRQLEERQVTLTVAIPADAPRVQGDPDRLRQIFVNLLDNAIKFSQPGGRVSVTAAMAESGLAVSVQDTGAGIDSEHLPRIFERFYRVDKARSSELGGTGLGLAIVKHLAELHRGGVTVRSEPGAGSTFTVTLPAITS